MSGISRVVTCSKVVDNVVDSHVDGELELSQSGGAAATEPMGWRQVMSTHASILVDSVGPPSAEVCRTVASFP